MTPAKKVAIKVYVPAGEWCESYTYKCPMLLAGHDGLFCVLVPESYWPSHAWIKKPDTCPSWLSQGNKLTEKDLVNERLRTFKKAAKERRKVGKEFYYGDEDGHEYVA